MNKFLKRSFAETLRLLLLADEEVPKKKGRLVVTRAALNLKIPQPTVKRWLDGYSEYPDDDNAEKLCKRFRVSRDQLLGLAPIPWIDKMGAAASPQDDETDVESRLAQIITDLRGQSEAMKELFIRQYLAAKHYHDSIVATYGRDVNKPLALPTPKKPKKGRAHE